MSYRENRSVITVIIKESKAIIQTMLPVPNSVSMNTSIAIIGKVITATFIEVISKVGFSIRRNLVNSALKYFRLKNLQYISFMHLKLIKAAIINIIKDEILLSFSHYLWS